MSTIDLHVKPRLYDFNILVIKANEDCYCTEEMAENISDDTNPTTCLPCACRFALNAIVTVAEKVKLELN